MSCILDWAVIPFKFLKSIHFDFYLVEERTKTYYIIIYKTGENNPIKFAQIPLLIRN